MPTTKDTGATQLKARSNAQSSHEAADCVERPQTRLATVDTAAGGMIAVTRPGMPRLFRFLLALTGVKV